MPTIPANQLSRGNNVIFHDELFTVTAIEHVKPGKGPAYCQAKLKNIETGKIIDNRFRAAEDVRKVDVDRKEVMYSYQDGSSFVFMDNETYEQVEVDQGMIGDDKYFLVENNNVVLRIYQGRVLGVELPKAVVLEVAETEPGVKNATATNVFKNAVTNTGLTIAVPPFINEGDQVKLDTETGKYIERV